jgi:iron complex outermembrane receptor protein
MASLFLLLVAMSARAQQAQITGTVIDPHNAVVADASVQVANQTTGAKTEVKTDNTGIYSALALQPGRYQITVSAKGFDPFKSAAVALTEGQVLVQDFKLAIGSVDALVTVTAFEGLTPAPAPNPITAVSGDQLEVLAGPGHSSAFLVADLVPGVVADTADPYGLSFTRSLNVRGRSDFFLSRTINGLSLYGIVAGTSDLFDLEDVKSQRVYAGPLMASEGFSASTAGGLLDQTLLDPRNAPTLTVEQGLGGDAFRRSFLRVGSGDLATGTAFFASASTTRADDWKGSGFGERDNFAASVNQKLGSAANFSVNYVHNVQRANTYDSLTYAQTQNLAQYYDLSYLSTLTGATPSTYNQLYSLNYSRFTDDALFGNVDYKISHATTLTFSPYFWHSNGAANSASGANISSWPQLKNNYGFTFNSDNQLGKNLRLSVGYWFASTSPDPPPVEKKTYTVNSEGLMTFSTWSSLGSFSNHLFNAPYAQMEYTKGGTVFIAGLRYQIYQSAQAKYFLTQGLPNVSYDRIFSYNPTPDPNAQAQAHTYPTALPNAGIQQRISDDLKLDLSYSRKIGRIDLGPQQSTFSSNEAAFLKLGITLQDLWNRLTPETDDVIDLIPTYHHGRFSITPDFYFIKAHNKEVLSIDPASGLAYYQSNGNTTGYGLDLSAKYQIAKAWSVYLGANTARESYDNNTSLLSGGKTSVMMTEGMQIPNDPKETAKGMLTYSAQGLDASFITRYVGSRYGLADDSQRVGAYSTSDLSVTYNFGRNLHVRGLALNFTTQNLFNRKYIGVISVNEDSLSSVSYYAGPSRAVVGSLTYSFSRERH